MRRVLQRDLMRGHWAGRLATLLFWALLAVLVVSVVHGVRSLPT